MRRAGTLALCLALLAAATGPVSAKGAAPSMTVAVVAAGSLPGVKDADLSTFLAYEMNAAGGSWRFEPVAAGKQAPPNRIEWSFKPKASAAGRARTYGFSSALVQRLIGARQFVTVEAILYLDGQYQTKSLDQLSATGDAADPDLAAELAKDTRQLMAYPGMDTRVDGIGPGGRRLPSP